MQVSKAKMTEDEVVYKLMAYLKRNGWEIISYCTGQKRGIDIKAEKSGKLLLIEAKGARGNAQNTKREKFDNTQIKTHFGKAIVKMLELKTTFPDAYLAIAQPDNPEIRKVLEKSLPHLLELDILHYWVSEDGQVKRKDQLS